MSESAVSGHGVESDECFNLTLPPHLSSSYHASPFDRNNRAIVMFVKLYATPLDTYVRTASPIKNFCVLSGP